MSFEDEYEKYFTKADGTKMFPDMEEEKEKINQQIIEQNANNKVRMSTADGNISTVEEFAELLRVVINTVYGMNKVELKPELSYETTKEQLTLPVITYDTNSREGSKETPLKPAQMETIKEVVNGKLTGDNIIVYRQLFDTIVEFDIYGNNSLQVSKISKEFEDLLNHYTGFMKKLGVSEMFFLKEIPSNKSVHYIPDIPMKSLMWYIRLEKISTIRTSTLHTIDVKINDYLNKKISEETTSDDIYKNNKISYNLKEEN